MSTVPSTFSNDQPVELIDASASGSTSWLRRDGLDGTLLHVTLANTDCVGELSIEACNVVGDAPYVIPFADSSGAVSTALAVASGVDVSEPFDIVPGFTHLRVTYTRTSGGTDQSIKCAASVMRNGV